MLIHTKSNCKNYSEKVRYGFSGGKYSKGEFRCDNPDCRCDVFYVHGVYKRYILCFEESPEPDDAVVFTLPDGPVCIERLMEILRVRCAGCGVTHGIAPADMIPYQLFSLPAFLTVVLYAFSRKASEPSGCMPSHGLAGLSWRTINTLLTIFGDYRARMMAALRMQGLYTEPADLSDADLAGTYLGLSPPDGARDAYLRCHKRPPLVNRRTTASCPLRFLTPASL